MAKKRLALSERKTELYNRLSAEIENCDAVLTNKRSYTEGVVVTAERYKPIFKDMQELLDEIFNGEDEDVQ